MIREIFVPGVPVSQGSMAGGGASMRHASGHRLTGWRDAIGWRVKNAHWGVIESGAVRLCLRFVLPRPKYHEGLDPAPYWHDAPADLDKLARAVCDALTKVAYRDDCQVAQLQLVKHFGSAPGVHIRLEPLGATTDGAWT